MADQYIKIYLITMKIITRGFSKSLITNLYLKFWNSRWRIQYGGPKGKKLLDWDENYNSEVFKVADYESSLEILKSNMADQHIKNYLKLFDQNEYSGVFGFAECELNNNQTLRRSILTQSTITNIDLSVFYHS